MQGLSPFLRMVSILQACSLDWLSLCSAANTRVDGQQAGGLLNSVACMMGCLCPSPAVFVPKLGGACIGTGERLGAATLNVIHTGQR